MKKNLFIFICAVSASFLIACSNDKTELSFTNDVNSSDSINDIVWGSDTVGTQEYAKWTQAGGYIEGSQTDSKEVSETQGYVSCSVWDGTNFNAASITINGGGTGLSLTEGASNNYTILAQ